VDVAYNTVASFSSMITPPPRPLPHYYYGWVIVGALFSVNVALHASANFTFGVFLKPMSEDLEVSRGAISFLQTARMLSGGLTALFIGRLLDRYGARLMLPIAAVIVGLAMISLQWAGDLWAITLLFMVIGGAGLAGPGALMTSVPLAKWFIRKRGLATAISAAGLGIGGVAFAPIHQSLIDAFGWRTAWTISGVILMVIIVPAGLLFLRRSPEDLGLLPDGEQPFEPNEGSPATPASVREEQWTPREALRTATMWKLLLAYLAISLAMGGFMVHRIPFWEDRGFDRGLIAWSLSLDALIFSGSILAAGVLVDRFPVRLVAAVATLFQIGGILFSLAFDSTFGLFATAASVGLGAGTNAVVQIHIWPTYYGRRFVGAIRGIVVPTTLIGVGFSPPLFGFIFDSTGTYVPALWMGVGLIALAAALLASAGPPRRAALISITSHPASTHKVIQD